MKTVVIGSLVLMAGLLAPLAVASTETSVLLYSGIGRILDLHTGRTSQERIIIRRTVDPVKSLITEMACVKPGDNDAQLSPVYMNVSGTQVTAISNKPDFEGSLSGTGELQGDPWNWNYLKFSLQIRMEGGHVVRIEDGNFVVNDTVIARKQVFYDEMPVQLWETEAAVVSIDEFDRLVQEMGCPAF